MNRPTTQTQYGANQFLLTTTHHQICRVDVPTHYGICKPLTDRSSSSGLLSLPNHDASHKKSRLGRVFTTNGCGDIATSRLASLSHVMRLFIKPYLFPSRCRAEKLASSRSKHAGLRTG
ncbi:hypothetical protein K449DRAFT_28870 [Hypoxylon sp. EC38]|nr:hypothetical protein K449DRAFT_28870 [Hypoxylon sp. EC38]